MVASASDASAPRKNPSAIYRLNDPQPHPSRRPLIPSERGNAAVSRRPRTKEVTSRYLSSHSSSSTTSTSYSSNTTISSSSSSSSSRRFFSPVPNSRPSTPPAKRSQSVDRTRPLTPRPDPRAGGGSEGSNAARALCTTTRSLSVSFQGESFFYQTSKAKSPSPIPSRKPTPERRRPSTPSKNSTTGASQQLESSKPSDFHHRWPAARSRQSSFPIKSLEGTEKNDFLAAVQLLRQSMLLDNGTNRTSFDGDELSAYSDIDSVSSGSNSGTPEINARRQAQIPSRSIILPTRSSQETNSRLLRQLSDFGTPLSLSASRNSATPKLPSVRRTLVDTPSLSQRSVSSLPKGPVRPSSPSKLLGSPSRTMASPSRARGTGTLASSLPANLPDNAPNLPANAPSILSFAAEVRRSRKGENRIEEAHLLRLLHNRHLQWRCVNARINTFMMVHRMNVEKNLYSECITTSDVRDLVTIKKIKLQFLSQNLKLAMILKDQMLLLEDSSLLDREVSSSLSGTTEALKASTLRLPVVSRARADLKEVKDAVGSAMDVMQAMGASMCSILSKVEDTKSWVFELARVAAQEQALLNKSRDLLSTIAALHVKQCSLQGHLLQLKRRATAGQMILQL